MTARFRLAELISALSLATDLGMGQPLEQALRTCLISLGVGRHLGLGDEELSEVYYVALLRYLGCTADAHESALLTGGDEIAFRASVAPVYGAPMGEFMRGVLGPMAGSRSALTRGRTVAGFLARGRSVVRAGIAAHCELAEGLALRLGLAAGVRRALGQAFERWDGDGFPNGSAGDEIARSARIVVVARDAEVLHRLHGADGAVSVLTGRKRTGAYDPGLIDAIQTCGRDLLTELDVRSPWEAVIDAEPEPRPWFPESRLDSALEAFADFVDLKSPFTTGHSRGVAHLVALAGGDQPLRRSALVHDLGRVAVPNGIWDKPSALTAGEWERVRLHPYYTERILSRSSILAPLAALAGMHHERLDGSGYHRGSRAADLPPPARLLAAADAWQAMSQARPHRPPLDAGAAVAQLRAEAGAGRLDREAVEAVLEASGQPRQPVRHAWPAGLSDREVQVLRLICRGASKRDVAAELGVSTSTVDHHVRHIYGKAGVASRAGAALFAVEHDLLRSAPD
jgi:HD-GYP domain-containing protein (c-di-GMP phosphodiesterase class II)